MLDVFFSPRIKNSKGLFTTSVSGSVSINACKDFIDLYKYYSHQPSVVTLALTLEIEFQTHSKASALTLTLRVNRA